MMEGSDATWRWVDVRGFVGGEKAAMGRALATRSKTIRRNADFILLGRYTLPKLRPVVNLERFDGVDLDGWRELNSELRRTSVNFLPHRH